MAQMDEARLEQALADLGDLTGLSMDELRARRAEAQELEVVLSYQRRLAQGRLDLVAAEQRRRREGDDPPAADELVASLATVLADRSRGPGLGRLPQLLAPEAGEIDTASIDAVVGQGALLRLTEIGDDEVTRIIEALSGFEAEISARRRALHERIDELQAEITRRYRTGEASVETLLR
jgi:hypothetical protein